MDRTTFVAELKRDGFELVEREMAANHTNPEHAHDFDARVMVLKGEITITRDGVATTYRAGDSCAVPRGARHAEEVGPEGVSYIAGRRMPA
ncbi:MAG: cupin domain-containing protein [Alphaproteobacteria bacterium]|nr:cupin domain-containing protein [Alphaproteobacteria bacterium]